MNSLWLAGLLALLVPPDPAQDPKPAEGNPASTNIRGAEYPRIHDDLRVTFRIKAPDAQKVEFGFFDPKRYEAKKGEESRKGKWQIRRKSEWAAALGSKRYFLSLFWKRFRHWFSPQLRCQVSSRAALILFKRRRPA